MTFFFFFMLVTIFSVMGIMTIIFFACQNFPELGIIGTITPLQKILPVPLLFWFGWMMVGLGQTVVSKLVSLQYSIML